MKVKICSLLRATVYLQLVVAATTLAWLSYDAWVRLDLSAGTIFWQVLLTTAILQALYAISVVRLMHHYAPSHRVPGQSFLQFYTVLASLNVATGLGLLVWVGCCFVRLWQQSASYGITNPLQWLQGCIVGSYAIISIYTIAGAARLKKAIMHRREWQVEVWLEEVAQLAAA